MQLAIKGIYEKGIIKPVKKISPDIGRAEVFIIFTNGVSKKAKEYFLRCAGKWKNVDTEKMKKKIYESRKLDTRKKIEL